MIYGISKLIRSKFSNSSIVEFVRGETESGFVLYFFKKKKFWMGVSNLTHETPNLYPPYCYSNSGWFRSVKCVPDYLSYIQGAR